MTILFSANISSRHRKTITARFPRETFIFCQNMHEAQTYLTEAEIFVTYGTDLSQELVGRAKQLKWIMVISAGLEKLPLNAIRQKDILVTNARGIHVTPMAEYVISMLLQVYRQEKVLIRNEKAREWDQSMRIDEIAGKTMAIIGTGAIGQGVARLAKAFGMTTLGVSRSGQAVKYFDHNYTTADLKTVLSQADFVISVLPSTPETKYLLTYDHFQHMPNHAIFLNMGRGDVVRESDILQAIRKDEISHAILDVFEEEPLPPNHPFWDEEKITLTPHLSGVSMHHTTRALAIFAENLRKFRDGRTDFVNKIDVIRGY